MALVGEGKAAVLALRDAVSREAGIAVRAMVCVALPLAIGVTAGHPEWGAAASFGGLAGYYVPRAPYRYRARVVAAVGAGLAIAVLIGTMVASRAWVAVAAVGVVAGMASYMCQAAELPPPRELMLILVLLAATGVPAGLAGASRRAELTAAGAGLAWLVAMSPGLGRARRRSPERQAVRSALAAGAALLDAVGTDAAAAARHAAVESVRLACRTVAQGDVPAGDPLARAVVAAEALLQAALHIELETPGRLSPDWGVAVRALIPAVTGGEVPATRFPGPATSPGEGQLLRAIEDARADLCSRASVADHELALGGWPGIAPQLRTAAGRHSVVLPAAARIGIAVGLGVAIGRALGLEHAYWVGLTTAAVLQGSNLIVTRRRVIHRLAGTSIGVGLAFAVLGWNPPIWFVVCAVALFQGLSQLVIATHYGVAVVGLTVLALLLFHVAAPGEEAIGITIGARLVDTGIGAVLALLLRRLLWPRATLTRLSSAQALTLRATSQVLAEAWAPQPDTQLLARRRRALQGNLALLRAVHADAMADAGPASRRTDTQWPVSAGVEELARLALSWPAYRPRPETAKTLALRRYLEELALAITEARPVTTAPPSLPGQPLTAAATAALTSAVADTQRIPMSGCGRPSSAEPGS